MTNTTCEYWVKVGDTVSDGFVTLIEAINYATAQHDTSHKAVSFGHYRWGCPIITAAWTARS